MRAFMKPVSRYSALVMTVLLCISSRTMASTHESYINVPDVVINKPAITDSIVGEALTGWIDQGEQFVGRGGAWGSFGITMSAPLANISYSESGVNYSVYGINGAPGIGFVMNTTTFDCIFLFGCPSNWAVWGPFQQDKGNNYQELRSSVSALDVKYQYRIKIIAINENIALGEIFIPGQTIGEAILGRVADDTPNIVLSGFSVTYTKKGCVASLSPPVISMGVISPLQFTGVGSAVDGNEPAIITLQCDSGLAVYATMTDQNNIGNSTDTLTLSPGSNASGVGVQFSREGSTLPVTYGPSSSFIDPSSSAQWLVESQTDSNTTVSIKLTPKYIQTAEPIVPGDANALASITFAYQ